MKLPADGILDVCLFGGDMWVEAFTRIHRVPVAKKLLVFVILAGLYAWFVDWLTESENVAKSVIDAIHSASFGSMILGVLLVFRTNSANDRWWEARKLWGQLVNDTRNLSMKVKSYVALDEQDVADFRKLVISFPFALREHLRAGIALNKIPGFEESTDYPAHVPAYIAECIFQLMKEWRNKGKIDGFEMMQLDVHARSFMDICGACERIKNSPIALSYRAILRQGVALNILSIPWYFANDCHSWTIVITCLVAYFMVGLELIAEDIEEPFGQGGDNLPLEQISRNIELSVVEILGKPDFHPDSSVLEAARVIEIAEPI